MSALPEAGWLTGWQSPPAIPPEQRHRPRFLFSQTWTAKHFLRCHSRLLLYPSHHSNSKLPPAQRACAIPRVACQYHPGMGGLRARPSLVASLSPGELLENEILGSGDCRIGLGTADLSCNSLLPILISLVTSKPAGFQPLSERKEQNSGEGTYIGS